MKLPDVEHVWAASAADAVRILRSSPDAAVLAGGQSLVPLLAFRLARPALLVDLGRCADLRDVQRDGGHLAVGAAVTYAELLRSHDAQTVPGLVDALSSIGHRAIRSRGTVGGSIAHADPAAELPVLAAVLGAEIVTLGPAGSRTLPADRFFTSYLTTALEPGEIVAQVRFPLARGGTGGALAEVSRRRGDFALAAAAALVVCDAEGYVTRCRLGFAGVAATPIVGELDELAGHPWNGTTAIEAARSAAGRLDPMSDLHATSAHRRSVAAVVAERALAVAATRAHADGPGAR